MVLTEIAESIEVLYSSATNLIKPISVLRKKLWKYYLSLYETFFAPTFLKELIQTFPHKIIRNKVIFWFKLSSDVYMNASIKHQFFLRCTGCDPACGSNAYLLFAKLLLL